MEIDWSFVIRPKLQVLSCSEVEYLFGRALHVLETIGVRVLQREALDLFLEAGAFVTNDSKVRIRSNMVQDAIQSAPKRLMIYDREGKPAMELGGSNKGGKNTYYGVGSDLRYTYDPLTEELRLTVSKDISNMAKVVDYLPHMDFLMSYGIPSDVPLLKNHQAGFVQMVKNSTKPIVFTSDNGEVCEEIIKMAAMVVGGMETLKEKPFLLAYAQPTSPLQHSEDALGKVFASAEFNIPVVYPPGMIPGATAPTTIAGTITQSLAEALSLLTVHQLKRRGAPIVLCGAHGCMDMKTAINVYAAPERLMTQAALASIYQYFGIPTWGFGGCTDAAILDEQAGMEFGMMSLWAALCGVNLAHDVGYLGSGMIGDLRAIVLNNEINSYVRHLLCRGVEVDKAHVVLDVMERVGPGGNYLGDEHTFKHFRSELWQPAILNRYKFDKWEGQGKKTMKTLLGERVSEILQKHEPKELNTEVLRELDRFGGVPLDDGEA